MYRTMYKMGLTLISFLLLSAIFLSSAHRAESIANDARTKDEEAVKQVIQSYFDALKYFDADKAKLAIHDKAKLFYQDGKRLVEVSGKRFCENLAHSKKPTAPVPYIEKILFVDINGDLAVVKAELSLPHAWWTGGKVSLLEPPPGIVNAKYFSLIRLTDGWKIVSETASTREGM